VTTVDTNGKANVATVAEVFNVSIAKPVVIGIAIRPATYTYELVKQSGEFVVNLTDASLLAKVDRCGSVSGRSGTDKFARFGLTRLPAARVAPPLIEECPVNIECTVRSIQTVGDHDLVLGDVVAMHVDRDKVDGQGKVITGRLDPLVYISGDYWAAGMRLGTHGFARGE
jgi:flavin reductase (DIM6/NTAB) family NADH-FMN oxidoreductase RutF